MLAVVKKLLFPFLVNYSIKNNWNIQFEVTGLKLWQNNLSKEKYQACHCHMASAAKVPLRQRQNLNLCLIIHDPEQECNIA